MSTRRRAAHRVLGLLAVFAAVGCCALAAALALGRVGAAHETATALAWVCGIASAVLAVAAVQEHSDPDDDPRYLATLVHGLHDEWRR